MKIQKIILTFYQAIKKLAIFLHIRKYESHHRKLKITFC